MKYALVVTLNDNGDVINSFSNHKACFNYVSENDNYQQSYRTFKRHFEQSNKMELEKMTVTKVKLMSQFEQEKS